jgi:hypothetical protein
MWEVSKKKYVWKSDKNLIFTIFTKLVSTKDSNSGDSMLVIKKNTPLHHS